MLQPDIQYTNIMFKYCMSKSNVNYIPAIYVMSGYQSFARSYTIRMENMLLCENLLGKEPVAQRAEWSSLYGS